MGFLDFFKKAVKINDPDFGELTQDYGFLVNDNFFFTPANKTINLILDTQEGPNQAQRDFYRKVEMVYLDLKLKIHPLMQELFRNMDEDFEIKDFDAEFLISDLKFPDMSTAPITWEMTFESVHDRNHIFTVTLHDFEPESEILIDG